MAENRPRHRLTRAAQCVMFWDTATNERFPKYAKSLLSIRACGEYCVLATKGEEEDQVRGSVG